MTASDYNSQGRRGVRGSTSLHGLGRLGVRGVAFLGCLLGPWWFATAIAQPISNLVFTVGTTIQDPSLQNWSYVLLGSTQPQLLAGKRFAIYGKTGFPTNGGPFTLRATVLD